MFFKKGVLKIFCKFHRKALLLRSLFTEVVARRYSIKKVLLEILQNLQENTCARFSFFNKACNFIKKETLILVFSCKFCKISKNTFSYRTPPVVVSVRWNDHSLSYFSLMHRCENNGNLLFLTFSCAKF